jgi:hypothetical protein
VRARGTHTLESAGGTSKGVERKQEIEGHSLSGECKGRDNSKPGKKVGRERHLHTRARREGTSQECKGMRAKRGTHILQRREGGTSQGQRNRAKEGIYILKSAEGVTSLDSERRRASDGHSLPGKA